MNLLPGAFIASESGVRVLVTAGLVRDLRARAIEAFVSLPRRGVEIGGVLFGHQGTDGIRLENFAEAPCEHRYGPSYALSADDREQLTELIAQPPVDGAALAGFFRSFTSREPLIEAADEEFVRQHVPRGLFVFLMLQPLSAQNCLASFRFFRDGELRPESETPPFAFDPARMEPEVSPQANQTPPRRSRSEGPAWASPEPESSPQAEPHSPIPPASRQSSPEPRVAPASEAEGAPQAPASVPLARRSRLEAVVRPEAAPESEDTPQAAPILPFPRRSRTEAPASAEAEAEGPPQASPILPPPRRLRTEAPAPDEAETEPGGSPKSPPILPPARRSRLEALAWTEPAPEPASAPPIPPPDFRSGPEISASWAEPAAILPPAHRSRTEAPAWAQAAPEPPSPRRRWLLLVAICLLGGMLGAAAHELLRLGQQPRWVELHLDARPSADRLAVTWDASAAGLTGATRALLSVRTAEALREIELTPQQIRAGRYDDAAAHGDASVRLILYAKGQGISGDSVRVVPAAPPAPVTPEPASAPAEPANATAAATTPPQAVREVQPVIPPGIRSRIDRRITIPVEVYVTARGTVSRGTAQTAGADGLSKYLAGQAEKAALQWRFTPAKSKRGVPMASAKTLNFVFTPSP
ncbi:MAG TPA: hypothetical protein VNV86_02590 [Candidatus Acidoferrum sp.]|nr:hypothetical protein [Candidatus Acidoferrum sp.]